AGNLDVSGFRAAQAGPVNIKMGMMAGEGDRSISGDFFQIRNRISADYTRLSHGGNTETNFFRGSIETGGNPRNPDQVNNFGVDIAMFDLPNGGTENKIIGNNQTSTRFRFGTNQDLYAIFNITFAVDAYVPEIHALHTLVDPPAIPATGVTPGDELTFRVEVTNKGNEGVIDGRVEIPIPDNITIDINDIEKYPASTAVSIQH